MTAMPRIGPYLCRTPEDWTRMFDEIGRLLFRPNKVGHPPAPKGEVTERRRRWTSGSSAWRPTPAIGALFSWKELDERQLELDGRYRCWPNTDEPTPVGACNGFAHQPREGPDDIANPPEPDAQPLPEQ